MILTDERIRELCDRATMPMEWARAIEREVAEACARICDDICAKAWADYKSGHSNDRAHPRTEGISDGAGLCGTRIREACKP